MTSANEVVLARQFRPGPGLVLDELPGGAIEDGEDPAEAAGRELAEETGYAGEIEIVAATWASGGVTRRRWAAVVTGCEQVGSPAPDDGEYCEPFLMSVSDFRDHLRSGQLTDVDIGTWAWITASCFDKHMRRVPLRSGGRPATPTSRHLSRLGVILRDYLVELGLTT